MERFDEIWIFVEKKLNVPIPTYFKNTLKACGYNNGISIATIEEDDVQYIESEVRNGNVAKFFAGDEMNLLDGSGRCTEDFVFSMGHKKFLLSIVQFIKNHMKENGQCSFSLEEALKKSANKQTKKRPEQKHRFTPRKISLDKLNVSEGASNQNEIPKAEFNIHRGILMCNAIMCIINATPEMYTKYMESINKKFLSNSARIELKDNPTSNPTNISTLEAVLCCPFCSRQITVFQNPNELNFSWNITNFDSHLKIAHLKQITCETKVTEPKETNDIRDENCTEPTNCTITSLTNTIVSEETKEDIIENPLSTVKHVETSKTESCREEPKGKIKIKIRDNCTEPKNCLITSEPKTIVSEETVEDIIKQPLPVIHPIEKSDSMGVAPQRKSQNVDLIVPEAGRYVICLLSVKNCIQWPATTPTVKYFVGQVCRMKESVGNRRDVEEFEIQLLRKHPHSYRIFLQSQNMELCKVSKTKIVKILQNPVRNRRGDYVFTDKCLLDYVF